jgi:UDP-2,3-diacylglucosamine pyrophosphatase LpxH
LTDVQAPETKKKYKIVISDCHLSAGRFFEGQLNPHEDFHHDDDMVQFFEYFTVGPYSSHPDGSPVEVELIINGDYFDYLNVPIHGEFEEAITEKMAMYKTEAIIQGHPHVMDALRRFAAKPGKTITYLVGNHDAELFFPSVRERITREWDPHQKFPSTKVEVVCDRDRLTYEGGVEVRHGNQFEAANMMNFERPLLTEYVDEPVLNIPWGSIYVLKIINRMKWERAFVDKVRPLKIFILFGLILDPWFTIRFCALSAFYFLKTRFVYSPKRRSRLKVTMEILKQETKLSRDLESEARELLSVRSDLTTVIFGHTHRPMDKIYPDGKQYINTGTWTRMINLDWSGLGQHLRRTFAYVEIEGKESRCELREWVGEYQPHQSFQI